KPTRSPRVLDLGERLICSGRRVGLKLRDHLLKDCQTLLAYLGRGPVVEEILMLGNGGAGIDTHQSTGRSPTLDFAFLIRVGAAGADLDLLRLGYVARAALMDIIGTLVAGYACRAGILARVEDLLQDFGIDSIGQLGRAHDVAEQNGKLASLSFECVP